MKKKKKINCKVNIRKLTVNIIQEKEINYYYYYVVEQLPEREPLNFDDINSTILQLKKYCNSMPLVRRGLTIFVVKSL